MKTSEYAIVATSEDYRDVTAFWRRQLAASDLIGALPATQTPRPDARRSIALTLSPKAAGAVDTIASDDLGRFTVITAGIALAIARYFNRVSVLLRSPRLPDGHDEQLNPAGEVPLVFASPDDRTLRQYLEDAAAIVEQSYSLQDYPIDALCALERGIDLPSQAEFSLSSCVIHAAALGRPAPVHFDLDLIARGEIVIDFDPAAIESFLLPGLASVINATLSRFDTLSTSVADIDRAPEEQRTLPAAEPARTAAPGPANSNVHELFEARARLTPDAVALRCGASTHTYRELNELSNRVAHHLLATIGAGCRATVGIWMDRSPWMVAAVLGVLKAGFAYLPIDADCPHDRVAYLIGDSGVRALLIDARKIDAASGLEAPAVVADRSLPAAAANPDIAVGPGDLAYVIYTSGSTGEPKGCLVEHHSLSNYLQWAIDYYWTSPDAGNMALFTPLSFDLTVPSLFCPLLRGRTLVIYPQEAPVDTVLRQQFQAGSTIDTIKLTPSHIRALDVDRMKATDVRLLIVGGEQLTEEHVALVHRIDPRIRVINEYGPTEATVGCLVKEIPAGAPIRIGQPIANTRAYVLDDQQRPMATGVRGEICIGGEGVARGYHNRPALGLARFVPDPFIPGARIYRTGDIGRRLPDGDFECFGRLDRQLKLRGYRVEPGEIEAALRRCVGVAEAVVVESGGQLIAYLVTAASLDHGAIRRQLALTLPPYMVPAVIVPLTELPLTPNGKVDRNRLPLPSAGGAGRRPYVAPRTAPEHVIARIWENVLRLDRVGTDEDFFELGGHSLRAMAIMRQIHGAFGVDVSVVEILSHPTVAALAAIVRSKTPATTQPITPVPDAEHYAVSLGQRRLWLIDRIEHDSPAYNVSAAFDLRGQLDLAALTKAVDALVARHESLRTGLVEQDDEVWQQVRPALRVPVSHVDLRGDHRADERLRSLAAAQGSAPFDLTQPPLLRVAVIQLENLRSVIAFTIHHAVCDAWSMRVLIAETLQLYDSFVTGNAAALPSLPIQYKDYAAWQRQWLDTEPAHAARRYWLAQLAGPVPALDLPADFARPPVPNHRGRHHYGRIDAQARAGLRTLGAAHGASLFMTLLAVVKALLYRYSGEPDVWVGSPIAGRTHADLVNQVGFYVNTLVLRDTVRGADSFQELLAAVRHTAEDAYEHQSFPFDRLVDELDVRRDLSRAPLFDVMVTYDSDLDAPAPARDLAVEELRIDSEVSKFDMTLAFGESDRGIEIEIEYRTDLFESARIERMAADLLDIIGCVVADATTPIDRLPITGAANRRPAGGARVAPSAEPPDAPLIAPRNEAELLLVGLLEPLLGRYPLGVTDNFFYAGGDSIKAVQLVNRLARQGWALRVRDLFEAPRIEDLARRLAPAVNRRLPQRAEGQVPLTPIQRWFFRTQPEGRAHYNQSVMLRFDNRLDDTAMRALARALVEHHDALRLRFRFDRDSVTQFYGDSYDPAEVHDLTTVPKPIGEVERLAAAAQASLDLERGPLARFVLFHLPDGDRLLAVVHHLAVDGVSWRILLDDLRIGLAQIARREPINLGPKSDSFLSWSLALEHRAAGLTHDEEWWQGVEQAPCRRLPCDADRGLSLESSATEQRVTLGTDQTEALRSQVHRAYNTRADEVLLTALAKALHDWLGPGPVRIDVEAHGRDGVDTVDVSRTVGWFTVLYPVVLNIDASSDSGKHLTAVKDALRRTPSHGLSYGLLRGGRQSGAPILFNFLGQFDTDLESLAIADEGRGAEQGPLARMTHDLVFGGWISEGRLNLTARYSPEQFRDDTIARLLSAFERALEGLIAHCRAQSTTARTATDFRHHDDTSATLLERIGIERVDDLYPLSPMQQGMLYHSLVTADSPVYFEQFTCSISGVLRVDAFRNAWDRVIARHTALRTAFFSSRVEEPLQVVFSAVEPPWSFHDWRRLSGAERDERLARFLEEDRRQGFCLDTPPLVRFALIRVGDTAHRFCWSAHHLVLDGWSTAIILQEVFGCYQALAADREPSAAPARPYGDYIDWLRSQDSTSAAAFWRNRVEGFDSPTPLPLATPPQPDPGAFAVAELTLSPDTSHLLSATAREHALTLNTVARGVWALVLGAHAHRDDVVFGATVAGRPTTLPDVEHMVGVFINTVPVRVRIEADAPLVDWLHRLQIDQADVDSFAYSALADIQRWSGVPPRVPLFESLLVFENYPVDQSLDPGLVDLSIDGIEMREQTNYPLTLSLIPGDRLLLRMSYDSSRYSEGAARAVLQDMAERFEAFAHHPDQSVASLLGHARAVARSSYELPPDAVAAVRTIADAAQVSAASVVEAAAAVCCFRASTHEDLQCVVGSARLAPPELSGGDTFGEALKRLPAGAVAAKCDLTFRIAPQASGLGVEAASETGRFGEPFLRRTRDHLSTLLAAIAADPERPIARLSLLPAGERSRLIDDFNQTDKAWGLELTIVEYFERQAAAHPDRIALVLPALDRDDMRTDETWSYGTLNSRANQLARAMVGKHGVGPNVTVGVLAERSFEMVLALVAVEKAGAAYVPLEPGYPPDVLRVMIEDSDATLILTQQKFAHLAAGTAVIRLDADWTTVAAESTDNLDSRVAGDDLAYVIFTSGSTGRPKGAMNTHRGIANRLLWMQAAYGLTEHDRVLQKTPFSFDVSVWEFFWPLMFGARLVIARPDGHRDAAYLASLVQNAGITTLHFVPSMLQAFIDEPGVARCQSLQRIICSGEAITPELLRRYMSRVNVPLHNLYGPTEAAVDVTAWECNAHEAETMVPIGRPITNIRLYILDAFLQPMPLGTTGELYLGGVGVGRGYLNRPELTAASFIEDRFRASADARLYRTGDLARYRENGVVDFLGRIDHQVKLRGFRIELPEIESVLLSHPAVHECVVVVREDRPGNKQLVGYVVLRARATTLPADVRAHLQRALPDHMVPGLLIALPALPRLTNGKIDRKALPPPEHTSPAPQRHIAPRTPVEQRLIRLWEHVLGHRSIGVTDDFFELGGHSILALKLVSAIEREFGRRLPLAQLLGYPTVERLALALHGVDDRRDWRPLVEIKPGASIPPLFLLPGAGGNVIYFRALAQRLTTPRPVYGLQAVGLDGRTPPLTTVDAIAALNIAELQRAWPSGPYLLAGHSFGGRVAFEMAQQLRRRGLQVALLALLDTAAPTFDPIAVGSDWQEAHWLAKIAREVEEFFGIRLDVGVGELLPLPLEDQLTLIVDRMLRAGTAAPGADREQLRGYLQVYRANSQAPFLSYDTFAPLPIALFKALESDPDIDARPAALDRLTAQRAWGWDRFADGEVRVCDVPGAHLSMLAAPHVSALARELDRVLSTVDGEAR